MMKLWAYFDKRARRMGLMDIKLVQGTTMCIAVIIVHMFPGILSVNPFWFVVAALVFAIKPVITFIGSEPRS